MSQTRAGPLQWRAGTGWLVLAGGGSWRENETGDVDAAVLGWADLDRPMAVVPAAGSSTVNAEALLDYYADLGGPHGYVVPIFDAAGAQLQDNCDLLEEAGLIYIADGPELVGLVRALRTSPAMEASTRAFESGAVIIGMGAGAAALGAWVAEPADRDSDMTRAEPGLAWLNNIILAPHFEGTEDAHRLRHLLSLKPNCLGMGIPDRVALGLGPCGEVENVGSGQVTVVVSGLEVEV
jgi:cyanophycinase-like exopeptidase